MRSASSSRFLSRWLGDDPLWPQSPDPVDGVAPGVAASVRRLGEVLVGAVVHHVAGDHEVEVGYVENGAVVGVAVARLRR